MPYLSKERPPLSTKDIISWGLEEQQYDTNKPLWIDASDPSRSISGDDARELIMKLVAGFRHAGLKPGDTVCIASFSEIYYSILVLGIIAAGCVFTGTNPSYTPLELEHHLRSSRAQLIICEPELLAPILATSVGTDLLAQPTTIPRILIFDHHVHPSTPLTEHVTPTDSPHHPSWRALLQHGAAPWLRFDDAHTSATTTAMLLFSSGTSGLPKPVPLSHANLIAQHEHALHHACADPSSPSYNTLPPWPVRRLSFLPPFHAAVAPSTHVSPLRSGDATFVLRKFDVGPVLAAVRRWRITDLISVPPCLLAIVNAGVAEGAMRSLRWVRVGAAPLGASVQRAFQEMLDRETGGRGVLTQLWGMTETSCVALQWGVGERDTAVDAGEAGSVGRPIVGLDVKVVDEEGREVREGADGDVRGELCVRGPTVVRGYLGEDGGLNRSSWDEEGYFSTGDIVVRVGKSGLWYVVDRKKVSDRRVWRLIARVC